MNIYYRARTTVDRIQATLQSGWQLSRISDRLAVTTTGLANEFIIRWRVNAGAIPVTTFHNITLWIELWYSTGHRQVLFVVDNDHQEGKSVLSGGPQDGSRVTKDKTAIALGSYDGLIRGSQLGA
jgi:hypothetical protein